MVMAKAAISRIDNDYVRAHDAAKQQERAHQTRRRVHKRRMIVMLLLLAVVCVVGAVRLHNLSVQQRSADVQLRQAKSKLAKVKDEKQSLKVQVDQLNNEDYLAKLVRSQYYVSKKGEIIFTLPASANRIPGDDSTK
jgi:cell division protein DivIC